MDRTRRPITVPLDSLLEILRQFYGTKRQAVMEFGGGAPDWRRVGEDFDGRWEPGRSEKWRQD